jgi:DHA1 family multidrug resistance protein-like MFS transporter
MANAVPQNSSLSRLSSKPRSWKVTLGIIFMAQLFSAVGFSMIFPFLPLYIEDLGSSMGLTIEFLAGMVIAVQGFTMMIASPIWGIVADRYGRKKMVLRSMLGGTVILAMMAFAQSAEQLIILRAIQGVITGTVSANNALVAAATPRDRIGFAMGTLQVGLWAGVAVGPLIGGVLADMFGYSFPFLLTAALLFIAGLTVLVGIHEDFEPSDTSVKINPSAILGEWAHILKTSGVSMVYFMRFLTGLARTVIIPIAPLFVVSLIAEDATSTNTYAGLVLAVSSATSTIGAIYLGNLGDRISHKMILFWSAFFAMVLYIPQVFVIDVWQLLILQGVAGIFAGGLVAAPSALLARYTDKGEAGSVYGLDNSVVAAARAVAPLLGASVAIWFGMRGTFAASAVVFGVIALITWFYLPMDALEKTK